MKPALQLRLPPRTERPAEEPTALAQDKSSCCRTGKQRQLSEAGGGVSASARSPEVFKSCLVTPVRSPSAHMSDEREE